MNILLINPWITDFSAYDFWIRPLGLLYAGSFLKERGHDVRLVDCMDRFQDVHGHDIQGQRRKYGTGKFRREVIGKPACLGHVPRYFCRYGIPVEQFRALVSGGPRPDVVLVTCVMTYWYHGAFEAISVIHDLFPGVPVLLGGIYASLCTNHARAKSGADAVIVESRPSSIIEAVESTGGKRGDGPVVPDTFDEWPEPLWGLYGSLPAAVTMTAHGCPMRCTVCASHILFDGFERRRPSHAVSEIHALAERGARDIAFCDDALLIDAQRYAMPMFEELASDRSPARLHTPNGLHVREITPQLAGLMKKAGVTTVRLSLETASCERAGDFSGKVTRDEFSGAVDALFNAGYSAREVGSYMLAGLPGQTVEEVLDTAEFILRSGITVKPALFSPVPGTVEFHRAVKAGMIREDSDPVLHNNTLRAVDFWSEGERGYSEFRELITLANKQLENGMKAFDDRFVSDGFEKLRKQCM
ncbi:radical SAM protein [bacterium]|nr:radical SAM protein [bacterium]